jgi:peptidoglycan/xylan/chitin deacetylase (PgdA/CDA1 family)
LSQPWHGDAAAVVTLTFDVDAEAAILAHGRRYARHAMTMSHQAYGPDVGVPRLLDLLDELGVPATFFIPGWVAEQRPGLAARIVDRGHEVAHHSYSHRPPTSMSPEEERADFVRALEVFARQGVEVVGHRAALWEATWQTAELVAEYGCVTTPLSWATTARTGSPRPPARSWSFPCTGRWTTGSSTPTCPPRRSGR